MVRELPKWSRIAAGGSGSLVTGLEVILGFENNVEVLFTVFVMSPTVVAAEIFSSSSIKPDQKAL